MELILINDAKLKIMLTEQDMSITILTATAPTTTILKHEEPSGAYWMRPSTEQALTRRVTAFLFRCIHPRKVGVKCM